MQIAHTLDRYLMHLTFEHDGDPYMLNTTWASLLLLGETALRRSRVPPFIGPPHRKIVDIREGLLFIVAQQHGLSATLACTRLDDGLLPHNYWLVMSRQIAKLRRHSGAKGNHPLLTSHGMEIRRPIDRIRFTVADHFSFVLESSKNLVGAICEAYLALGYILLALSAEGPLRQHLVNIGAIVPVLTQNLRIATAG